MNQLWKGRPPLYDAIDLGHLEAATILLKYGGADPTLSVGPLVAARRPGTPWDLALANRTRRGLWMLDVIIRHVRLPEHSEMLMRFAVELDAKIDDWPEVLAILPVAARRLGKPAGWIPTEQQVTNPDLESAQPTTSVASSRRAIKP